MGLILKTRVLISERYISERFTDNVQLRAKETLLLLWSATKSRFYNLYSVSRRKLKSFRLIFEVDRTIIF